jgi:2-polyprenyl-3-methyl-5-hydroxy-6-metoxy-1,4-benzoquinol methylase
VAAPFLTSFDGLLKESCEDRQQQLVDRPVEKECGVIAAWLVSREILPGAAVLDAGCGTGRYSRDTDRLVAVAQLSDSSDTPSVISSRLPSP